jgi:transposase-like protein
LPHQDCKCEKVYAFKDGKTFRCAECKKRFSARLGSIFQDSNIPLKKWFMAIYLITNHKKSISSVQLSKDIGVTQKTAWFILHIIRYTSKSKTFNEFQGTVEADECYVGGSESNKHTKDKFKGEKAIVFGLVNRETKQVKSFNVSNADKENLLPKIGGNVKEKSIIVTDSYHAYNDLRNNYKHKSVKHSVNEHVKNELDIDGRVAFQVHTYTIEGYWALVKRTINGTYHWVSKKHLQRYLIECDFRYNTKEFEVESQRFDCFLQNKASKLSYNTLIS